MSKRLRSGDVKNVLVRWTEELQHSILVGFVVGKIAPGQEVLRNISLRTLFFKQIQTLVLPAWLNTIPSLKTITISECAFVYAYDIRRDTHGYSNLEVLRFSLCERVYLLPSIPVLKLTFHYCNHVRFDHEIGNVCIKYIEIVGSTIYEPGWIRHARQMIDVSWTKCNLVKIPPEIFEMRWLKRISFLGNHMDAIPKFSAYWPRLMFLGIETKPSVIVPDETFEDLDDLENLEISGVPSFRGLRSISQLPKLRRLWVGETLDAPTDPAGRFFESLECLSVALLNSEVPAWAVRCKRLKKLRLVSLSGTKKVPPFLDEFQHLQSLILTGNFEDISIVELMKIQTLSKIKINGKIHECRKPNH